MKTPIAMGEHPPILYHLIRTTASAGATPKREWHLAAAMHEVIVKMRFAFVQGAA